MKVRAESLQNLQVEIEAGGHRLVADEPISGGGDDRGPDPYGLLLASLAACKVMTAHLYASRKGWALEKVSLSLETDKVHAKDCEDCESDPEALVDIIRVNIGFEGELDPDQRARLAEIADRCPVHRTLTSETKIRTTLKAPV